MTAYYNDNDRYAAEWLDNLQTCEFIPRGQIDTRSIKDINPDDLADRTQCHFFAGIGGWPYTLHLVGWPDDRPVWTGSCPCQPFSVAGRALGTDDPRHLWPEFFRLIAVCRPPTIFGEQVASRAGRKWLAGVRADLEDLGYAVGAADLCAAGVGAPQIRQRLFWVADAGESGRRYGSLAEPEARTLVSGDDSEISRLADAAQRGRPERSSLRSAAEYQRNGPEHDGGMGDTSLDGRREERANTGDRAQGSAERSGLGYWSSADWLPCLDGKARRIEPGTFPLAHGIPNRVGRLHAYGNAIVPPLAATFVRAAMAAITDL